MPTIIRMKRAVRDVVIPLGGVGLAFYLAVSRTDSPTFGFMALAMMGFPLAGLAGRLLQQAEDDEK